MPTAAIYCRISKEDQSIYSLSTQEASCRNLAKDYDVINTYADDGYSSERLDRPGLDAIRDLVRAAVVDVVVVYSPDRLTRKLGHMLILVDEFERHGVKLFFVTDPTDDSPSGKLMQHVRSAISEYELAMLRERTRRGQKARIQNGLLSLGRGIPYGYDWIPVGLNSRGELVINNTEADIVREIFQLRIQGYGSYRIARLLTLRGIPTKRGNQHWHPKVVVDVLTNEAYIGRMFHGRLHRVEPQSRRRPIGKYLKTSAQRNPQDQWSEIRVPAIITPEIFHTVQDLMANSKITNPRRSKHIYLLRHRRLQCHCSRYMTGYFDRGRRWYRCSRNKTIPACYNRVNADWIEEKAWEVVQLLLELDRPFLDVELRRRSKFTSTYRESDLQPVRSAISQKSTELQRLETAYLSGAFELPRFMELKSSITSELQQLQKVESEILDDLDRQQHRNQDIDAAAEFITRVKNEDREYDAAQRQQLIEALDVRLIY